MPKFFSFIKNKKTFYILLFLAVVAISVPQIAFASWWSPNVLANFAISLLTALIAGYFSVEIIMVMILAAISKAILGAVLYYATNVKYTTSDAVNIGWPIVRNLANMMIVLGFVVIGIATALRVKEYEAKALLSKLIIAALLINFSRVLCGVFIDGTNILMNFFFMPAGGLQNWLPDVSNLINFMSNSDGTVSYFAKIGPLLFSIGFFDAIACLVYLLYSSLILFRVMALWMLVILSPLAFVCYVFPATKKIWTSWWNNFFQWCIVVLPAGLFYYVGSQIISKSVTSPIGNLDVSVQAFISNNLSTIFVPATFMIVGFIVSLQTSAMGASSLLNFANKNKGKALSMLAGTATKGAAVTAAGTAAFSAKMAATGGMTGAIGKPIAKILDNTVGRSARFAAAAPTRMEQAKTAIMEAGVKIGAIDERAGIVRKQTLLKETQAGMVGMINQGKLHEIQEIAEGRGAGKDRLQRAGAVGALLETNKFNAKRHTDVIANDLANKNDLDIFQDQGGDLSKHVDKNKMLAKHDRSAVANTTTQNPAHPGERPDDYKKRIEDLVSEKPYKNMTDKKLQEDTGPGDVNEHLLTMIDRDALDRTADKYSPSLKESYRKIATIGTPENIAAVEKEARLRATGVADDIVKADRLRDNVQEIITNRKFHP